MEPQPADKLAWLPSAQLGLQPAASPSCDSGRLPLMIVLACRAFMACCALWRKGICDIERSSDLTGTNERITAPRIDEPSAAKPLLRVARGDGASPAPPGAEAAPRPLPVLMTPLLTVPCMLWPAFREPVAAIATPWPISCACKVAVAWASGISQSTGTWSSMLRVNDTYFPGGSSAGATSTTAPAGTSPSASPPVAQQSAAAPLAPPHPPSCGSGESRGDGRVAGATRTRPACTRTHKDTGPAHTDGVPHHSATMATQTGIACSWC